MFELFFYLKGTNNDVVIVDRVQVFKQFRLRILSLPSQGLTVYMGGCVLVNVTRFTSSYWRVD